MRRWIVLLVGLPLVAALGLWAATQSPAKIRRAPLAKSEYSLQSPPYYSNRMRLESGKEVEYDPRPRVQVVDAKAGKYELKWIGYDGKEKVVVYQRADAIDAIVSASVEKSANGQYVYTYVVESLPSSATYLSYFMLQNFSADAKPTEINGKATSLADLVLLKAFRQAPSDDRPRNIPGILIGEMSSDIQRFKEGSWIAFSVLSDFEPAVLAGRRLELKLISNARPGLVGCSAAAGDRTMKGAGEHMPSELEAVLPGYNELPGGYTVGPIGSLDQLSTNQRAVYLIDQMSQFEKLGWITRSARRWYEKNLRGDIDSVLVQAERDLNSEQISTEVFSMLKAIKS